MIYKALFIPWDDMQPLAIVDYDDCASYPMEAVVFPGDKADHEVGWSNFVNAGTQLWFDDLGSYNQRPHVNVRAMKLYGYLSGRPATEFRQNLYGDFVAIGLTHSGDVDHVPDRVKNFFAEENIHLKSGD
jgi:hypothetical protein